MKRFFFISLCISFFSIALIVSAAPARLIPCEGANCQACHLKDMLVMVINFIIMLASFVGTVLFMWAGFMMVTAAGNIEKVKKAKAVFKDVAIGIVIMLSGYLIVNVFMGTFVDPTFFEGRPWQDIACVPQPVFGGPVGGRAQPGAATVTPRAGGGAATAVGDEQYGCAGAQRASCVDVSATAVRSCAGCSFGGACDRVIDPRFATALTDAGGGWCASSIGIEPGHGSGCHLRGNCIDAKCTTAGGARTDCTPEAAAALQRSFTGAGLRPVYELPPSQADQVARYRAAGVCAYVEPRATGPHFSVYHGGSREGAGQFARAGGAAGNCPN